jgi:hypothetical protein
LKLEQFKYWKQNKSPQKEQFNNNKCPEEKSSCRWFQPKEIFNKKCKNKIQQSQTNEEN